MVPSAQSYHVVSVSFHSPQSGSDSPLTGVSDQRRDISELVHSGDMMTQDGGEGVRSRFVPNTGADPQMWTPFLGELSCRHSGWFFRGTNDIFCCTATHFNSTFKTLAGPLGPCSKHKQPQKSSHCCVWPLSPSSHQFLQPSCTFELPWGTHLR